MSKVRNGVIIIILCLIGAASYISYVKKPAALGLNLPPSEQLKDAVAGRARRAAPVAMRDGSDDTMRDAVAGHAAGTPAVPGTNGSTLGDIDAPPRGSGDGGFAPLANDPRPQVSPYRPQ